MCGNKATGTNSGLELLKVVCRMCLKDTGLQFYLCLYCKLMWDFPVARIKSNPFLRRRKH